MVADATVLVVVADEPVVFVVVVTDDEDYVDVVADVDVGSCCYIS